MWNGNPDLWASLANASRTTCNCCTDIKGMITRAPQMILINMFTKYLSHKLWFYGSIGLVHFDDEKLQVSLVHCS